MANFYAYKPQADGRARLGTEGRLLFKLKTKRGAIRRATRALGYNVCVYTYSNFYDNKTFRKVYGDRCKLT